MKFGAAFLLLALVSLVLTVAVLGGAVYLHHQKIALVALGLLGLSAVLFIVYRLFASGAHCPLCRSPVLGGSRAQRNRNARRFLGSYRLRVACSILARNKFVCPYCNEATCCTVKDRNAPRRRG